MQAARAKAKAIEPARSFDRRELGVYMLPDGNEYVVSTLYADGCCLYLRQIWWLGGDASFWVRRDGELVRRAGRPVGARST